MEKKRQYLQLAVQENTVEALTNETIGIWQSNKGMSHFYKAFASLDRAEGVCRLICIWRENGRRSMLAHRYTLLFNAGGIKEYQIEDIPGFCLSSWLNEMDYEMVEIELSEAADLILDAYMQNKKFKTQPALGIDDDYFMFQYAGDRTEAVNQRLLPDCQNINMFINIYLSAFIRLDYGLLYDLSSSDRQRQLGDRHDYLQEINPELSQCTFLSTQIVSVQKSKPLSEAEVSVTILTPQEEIWKLSYKLKILYTANNYSLLDFQEISREQLDLCHPQNPLNYKVYTTLFKHNAQEQVRGWLNEQANVFLTGETGDMEQYKWLVEGSAPWEEYCFSKAISAEFFLTDKELLIYCQKPENLASINWILAEDLPERLSIQDQYYLDNKELLYRVCNLQGETKFSLSQVLEGKRAVSHLLVLHGKELSRFMGHVISAAEKMITLGNKFHYYFIRQKDDTIFEIYSYRNYQWVTVYSDPREGLLGWIKENFILDNLIPDYELEDYYDLFTPPLTEQRKWEIFQQLMQLDKEASCMRKMGLVPSVKEAATQYGVVI